MLWQPTDCLRLGNWDFHEIRLEDRELFASYIKKTEYPANLWSSNFAYLWAISQSESRRILWRIVDGMLAVFVHSYKDSLYLYCLPFGPGDSQSVVGVLDRCLKFCYEWNKRDVGRTMVKMINAAQMEFLGKCSGFREKYRLVTWIGIERHFDVHALSSLKGKDFSGIRNRLNKFRREHPDARMTEYEEKDFDELIALSAKWKETSGKKYSAILDGVYYREILRSCRELGQKTLVIRLKGRIIGMISGSELPTGQSWGSVIKYEEGFPGLSETLIIAIVKELNRMNPEIRLMNSGSDLGAGGLRDYKLKFRPALNLKRYQVFPRPEGEFLKSGE